MPDHTTGDTGGSRRNVRAHPAPQVHLLVDTMKLTGWQAHSVRGSDSATKWGNIPQRSWKLGDAMIAGGRGDSG
jgi:hypothetical protein